MIKIARQEGEDFDCSTWLDKAPGTNKEEFKREVEGHLTGRETESRELRYFKVYKSQLPVIELALETAGRMLGTNTSRGMTNLHVHQIRRRGDLGDDARENLITLCAGCHQASHLL